jgi:hypothetical protein
VTSEETAMADDEQGRVIPDEERTRQILEQLKSVHAFDLAYETMVGLVNFGSQKMGLLDETREVRDLADARLSIELIRAILEVVEREQGPDRTRGLHDALAQMQLAYAHAVQLDSAEREAARGPAVTPAEESPPEPEPAGAAAEAAGEPAATPETQAAKKPAPKRPAAKKPAAKKPAAQKKPVPKKKPAGEI